MLGLNDIVTIPHFKSPILYEDTEEITESSINLGITKQEENTIRVICISDTHNLHNKIKHIPEGDILIHAGDFTESSTLEEIIDFNNFLGMLPHKYKIVIAGNHEYILDPNKSNSMKIREAKSLLTNCIYLEHESLVLYNNIRIFGTPYQKYFCDMAFNIKNEEELTKLYKEIPSNTDILITHDPGYGIGDNTMYEKNVGVPSLIKEIRERIHPKLHVFGHIHEAYGGWRDAAGITYFNASSVSFQYYFMNLPLVYDIHIP